MLWDDINFEHEYTLVAREAAAKMPQATSPETLDYDRWSEIGADAVMIGWARPAANGVTVEIRVIGIRGNLARRQVFGKAYGCQVKNARSMCALHFRRLLQEPGHHGRRANSRRLHFGSRQ